MVILESTESVITSSGGFPRRRVCRVSAIALVAAPSLLGAQAAIRNELVVRDHERRRGGSRATRDKGQARQRRNLDSLALSTSAIRPIPKRSRARVARSHGSRRLTGARACLTWSPSSRSAGWYLRRIARTDSGCSGCQLRSRPDLLERLVADRIQAPVLVVEVPPLRVINAEALRFHGPAE